MEVTKENFDDVFSRLKEDLDNAQFFAIDTEFTGLKVEGASSFNYYDTLDDLYLKNRLKAETFMAIQVGIVMFFYEEKTKKYSHLGYNFYIFPSTYSDINFTCQSKSIQFLIEHGFDFNKVFKNGVPYLKEEDAEKLIEKLTEKYEKNFNSDNSKKIMEISNEHQAIISSIISRIQIILKSNDKTSFTTESYNSYIRRLIYNSVQLEFGASVFLDTNKDETMTIFVGFTSQEIKEKQRERLNIQKNDILNNVGFSKVIKLLIESKKLMVGHNLFLDLLFIINQFLTDLPETYKEFKELIQFVFPNIIDTKHIAAVEMKNLKCTSLNSLVEYFENSKTFPEVLAQKNGFGHKIEDRKLHEASYDAYLTGLCFLAMVEQLGTSGAFKNLPKSKLLEPFLNKLSTPKLHDIFYMNLGGSDNEPDRSSVYHLTFPMEWTRDNITQLFKNCGFINIAWINNTSAYVKVKGEYIKEVENLMSPNEEYKLLTFSEFKSLSSNANLTLNPTTGSNAENSFSTESPVKINSNETVTKRKVEEEDLGEVIERPKKKRSK